MCAHLDRLDDEEMRELVTDAWRMCTPTMLHELPELPEPTAAAWAAMDEGEWGELRPLLHPYLHFDDGRTRSADGPRCCGTSGSPTPEAAHARWRSGTARSTAGSADRTAAPLHRIAAMTQQPFSRPGAIDLSALKRPAAGASRTGAAGGGSGARGRRRTGSRSTSRTSRPRSRRRSTAPVLLVFYSPSRLAESEQMARDLATVAEEYEGRFLAGLVDIDASPAIAQAVQLPSVPYVFAVLDGRPAR